MQSGILMFSKILTMKENLLKTGFQINKKEYLIFINEL